ATGRPRLCRGGRRAAASDGHHEGPGGGGVVRSPPASAVPESAGEPPGTLDGVDALRRRPADPDGQQRLGAVLAWPGGGAQELLRVGGGGGRSVGGLP